MNKFILLLVAALLMGWHSYAYEIRSGNEVTVSQPVQGNLYISAGTVTISAPVQGDLIIAGGTVIINDTVRGDILVCGGKLTVSGFTGGSIRCVGGEVHLAGHVSGDLAGFAGTIEIARASVIHGGLLGAGGTVVLDGEVMGPFRLAAGKMTINGTAKDLDCRGGEININGIVNGRSVLSADKITVGKAASFRDTVRYWSDDVALNFGSSLTGTTAVYDASLKTGVPRLRYLGFATLLALVWYLGTCFLLIMLIRYLLGSVLAVAGTKQQIVSGASFGYGLAFAIGVPAAVIICFITLVGIPIGIILLVAYIIIAALGTMIASVLLAGWLQLDRRARWNMWQFSGIALGIAACLKLVTAMLPFIGWALVSLVILSSYGAILRNIRWRKPAIT